ncbi:MAG: hypothetical protein OER88_10555, partial [Planctomycetota bacterium]|nr:hypothetical protein [Planctomycetota bacterium]
RTNGRTSQAVIAILGAFTGILFPFSIYSLWVLFSHRGRTYYDARGRGLDERGAAKHTFRVLQDPFGGLPLRPAGKAPTAQAPVPRAAPRPSQIPVQSMVTSQVTTPSKPVRKRISPWLILGIVALVGSFVISASQGPVELMRVAFMGGLALIGISFFHALFVRRMRGAGVAMSILFAAFVLCVAAPYLHRYLPWELMMPIDDFRAHVLVWLR